MASHCNLLHISFKQLAFICFIVIAMIFVFSTNLNERIRQQTFARLNGTVRIRPKYCTVIMREPMGRLGNVLFEFATAYGLSLGYSCHLYIGPGFIKELKQFFEIDLPDILNETELTRKLPAKQIYNHCTFMPDLFSPNSSQVIELTGYWQVQKYFVNQSDQIRRQLTFKKSILNRTRYFIQTNISRHTLTRVGIHLRRGDFVGTRTISSDQFVFDAMNYFVEKYPRVNFIIVSDDKSYCQKTFGKRNDTFFTPDSFTPAEDLAILSECDHVIVTVGTYGWWGAFLLRNRMGEVITDAKPNYSPLDVDCERSAYFPDWFKFLNKTRS